MPAVIEQEAGYRSIFNIYFFIFYSQVHNIASVSFFKVTKTFFYN